MKSPFPGMDPYLECHWRDVHASLIIYARDQLQPQLPRKLCARVEERLIVEPEEGEGRSMYPDVRVVEQPSKEGGGTLLTAELAITEPVLVPYDSEQATETFLNIIEPGTTNRLVTVIEFLSASNKSPGESQDQYRQKQKELRASKVSLVEVDLLRTGKRVLSLPTSRMPKKLRTLYQVCVRRGWRPSPLEVYPVPLQRRLPIVRIPLRAKDEDVRLDLQALVDQAYDNGAYEGTIDYKEPPEPSLAGVDAVFAEELLRQAGKR
jgi:hypothetical protein